MLELGKPKVEPKERIGTLNKNKFGSEMLIYDYINPIDIWVKFINTDEPLVHTSWQHFCKGSVRSFYDKTVHDVGYIGIGNYKVSINRVYTPHYISWNRMMDRCYSERNIKRNPTYKGCSVTEEWHNFQNFAKWYDKNYYTIEGEKMQLDKDILVKGNKVYSPDTCVFVPAHINSLFIKNNARRGSLPIGVSLSPKEHKKKYRMKMDVENGKQLVRNFDSSIEAFLFYKVNKERIIKNVANEYKDKIPLKLYEAMMNYTVDIKD